MEFIKDISVLSKQSAVGGKAQNLAILKETGLDVPKWVVIPAEILLEIIPQSIDHSDKELIFNLIDNFIFPDNFIKSITDYFPEKTFFAVRSSALDEDGNNYSFAGQFESFLYVTKDDLDQKIKEVWKSAFSQRVNIYRQNNSLDHTSGIAVIIQQMINADVSGVAFGIDPANGDRSSLVINSVWGLGEGLVSGALDADHFILKNGEIQKQLAEKKQKVVINSSEYGNTKLVDVDADHQSFSTLSDHQLHEIADVLEITKNYFGKPQDIEFAIEAGHLFILQARPITNLDKLADVSGEYILWDNSNIIESYPGVTTPLTFSFISKSYEGAYKLFSGFMGVSDEMIQENSRVFENTLGMINGRVYYNLKTWYQMLAMLPGYSINARFMEKMMGVKERFDIPESYLLSKSQAWWSIVVMAVKMTGRLISLPKKRKEFLKLLDFTIHKYKSIDLHSKNSKELLDLYLEFEKTLLNQWIAPLLNDFFAMIFFGTLQKTTGKYRISDNPNIHNDLLCGSSDIISTQPIHRTIELSELILKDPELRSIFSENDERQILQLLSVEKANNFIEIKSKIDQYILEFGERCVGELKLETVSYTQDPALFIKILKSYVVNEISLDKTSRNIEKQLRINAENELNKTLKNNFFKRWYLKKILIKTRELVSARENLRYERTRAFGIVRELFAHLGKRWYADNLIDHPGDIFYLTKEEISAHIEGRSVTQNIKGLIQLRKSEFENYKKAGPLSERFPTFGIVYHGNDYMNTTKTEPLTGDLKGIGCCPGRVKGKVRVVLDPQEISTLNGDILVTSSTDPGWVTLFPSASGIIVERGSLLSHSAIVSREMGKPCIVGVTGLLKTLRTGDEIEMDGSTGEIKIFKPT